MYKIVALLLIAVWNVMAITDQTVTDSNGKSWALFAELEKGRAFLVQHEDAW